MNPLEPPRAPLDSIDSWLALRKSLDRDAFLGRLAGPVLLVPLDAARAEEGELRTVSVTREGSAPLTATLSVAVVAKRGKDAFQNFIWVGRESRCDVSIPLETVSKLQAQFTRKPDGSFELLDVGSTNGTWVGDNRLEKNRAVPVRSGARIRFGRLTVTFLSPEAFWDELGRLGKK